MWFLAPRESVTWRPLKSDPTGSLLIKSARIFFFKTTNTSNLSPLWFFLSSVNCLKQFQDWIDQAYSGTLTRREIVRANASLGELRRDKEKLSSPISCELRRDKASQGELRENGQPNVEVIRVNTYIML